MQSFWYAVHQLLQGLVVSQRALHLGIIQSRCKKSQKELCAKELCANANVFDLKKNWSKLLSVTRKWRGKKKK